MNTEGPAPIRFDTAVLSLLACPACKGKLRLDPEHLLCLACGRAYPVIDGIPVLIAERAEPGAKRI